MPVTVASVICGHFLCPQEAKDRKRRETEKQTDRQMDNTNMETQGACPKEVTFILGSENWWK